MEKLLASGRDADVYLLADGSVLRRYRRVGVDTSAEAARMRWVADHGFPVPRVYRAAGLEMVMERIPGPTLLQALADGTTAVADAAVHLTDLLRRLHEVPAMVTGLPPSYRVCHRDLHPDNVILSSQGPVVIDWSIAHDGPPGVDTALTLLILGQVAALPGPYRDTADTMTAAVLAGAEPFTIDDLLAAAAWRSANPTLTAEEVAVIEVVSRRLRAATAGPVRRAQHRPEQGPRGHTPAPPER